MNIYEYEKATSLDQALSTLNRYGTKAVLIAGGTDIIPELKKKNISPEMIVSLRGIPGMDQIISNGSLSIGAMTTHRMIEKSQLMRRRFSSLTDAADVLGSIQIRNVATIGGNICTAAPSADMAPPLLVMGAQVRAESLEGGRTIALENFFTGPSKTVLADDEIVTELTIPELLPHTASAYWKHQRRLALDLPILGVAVQLSLDKNTITFPDNYQNAASISSVFEYLEDQNLVCRDASIALGVAAPAPMRAYKAEKLLKGQVISSSLLEEVAQTASQEAQPRDSIRGEAWYRREMIKVFVQRMILKCLERIARQD